MTDRLSDSMLAQIDRMKKAKATGLKQIDHAASNLGESNDSLDSPERAARTLLLSLRHVLDHGDLYLPQFRAASETFAREIELAEGDPTYTFGE